MSSGEESEGTNNGESNENVVQKDNSEEEEEEIADQLSPALIEMINEKRPIGVAMALACTSTGGITRYMEATVVKEGEGIGGFQFHETAQFGNVMKDSVLMAYTVARSLLHEKVPENPFFRNSMIRLDVLGGSTRSDGSSAGCTMVTAFLSLAIKKPVRKNLAMTGVVTIMGTIGQISSVREKTIAAKRSQVEMIIFPEANRGEFDELEDNVKDGLDARFVDNYDQIFKLAFGYDL